MYNLDILLLTRFVCLFSLYAILYPEYTASDIACLTTFRPFIAKLQTPKLLAECFASQNFSRTSPLRPVSYSGKSRTFVFAPDITFTLIR